MSEESDLLAGTRPLSDPLQTITIMILIFAAVSVVLSLASTGIWTALGFACPALGFALLFAPTGKPNAIYLRAFRTDSSTAKLRSEIAAILGPGFRLSGIRPPREKTSMFIRFLLPGLFAMRYAGSKFMELEAGDDWMARLWKTYQTTRLVLIDIREMTPHVHQEIRMTLQTVSASRCVFVIGQEKTESQWRELLSEIIGTETDPAQLQLLDVSPARVDSGQMEADIKDIVKRLPEGEPGELERGRQFIVDHVSEQLLKESRRVSAMTVVSIAAALVLALAVGALVHTTLSSVIFVGVIVIDSVLLVMLIRGMFRAAVRAVRLKRAGHTGAAMRAWSVLLVASILFLAGPTSFAVQSMPRLEGAKKAANETSAFHTLRALNEAELLYSSTYPKIGYACSLSALGGKPDSAARPEAAQLIEDELASSGKKSGYAFTFSNCAKTKVEGQSLFTSYQITAVPDVVGRTGDRGFCSDQTMEIRSDPNGGSDCARPQQ